MSSKSHYKLFKEHLVLNRFGVEAWPHLHVFDNGLLCFEPGGSDLWFYEPEIGKWFQKEYAALSDLRAGQFKSTLHVGPNVFIYLARRFGGDRVPIQMLTGDSAKTHQDI